VLGITVKVGSLKNCQQGGASSIIHCVLDITVPMNGILLYNWAVIIARWDVSINTLNETATWSFHSGGLIVKFE